MPHPNKLHGTTSLFFALFGRFLGAFDTADEFFRQTDPVGRWPNGVIYPDYAERIVPFAEKQTASFTLGAPLTATLTDRSCHLFPCSRRKPDLVIILAYDIVFAEEFTVRGVSAFLSSQLRLADKTCRTW